MATSLETIAEVFGFGRIQDLLTLLDLLAANGYSLEDLTRYRDERIADRVARQKEQEAFLEAFTRRAKRCPECGAAMNLAPVNAGPRDQVGGGYQSQWICPNGECMETVYNTEAAAEIVQKMGLTPPGRLPAPQPRRQKPCGGCNGKA